MFGQIKFGTYSQLDTSFYADLKLYSDKKFDFYDTRDISCWGWSRTIGKWKLDKDTIIFSWQSFWRENPDSIISEIDSSSKNIEVQFLYDNGRPISNVKTSLSCSFETDSKYYYSDVNGKVVLPKRVCPEHGRMFYYEVKNQTIDLSSNASIDYFIDSLSNIFTIIIKRKPKSGSINKIKKYLVQGNTLIDIDHKESYSENWGDFKYMSEKYGR